MLSVQQCIKISAYVLLSHAVTVFEECQGQCCCYSAVKMLRQIALAALCITAAALVAQRTPATATDDALANLRRAMAEKPAMTRKTFGTASVAAAVTAFAKVAAVDASGAAWKSSSELGYP